ncbi:MAG: hypothetical protein KAI17_14295, partial [Thiotrichaceae bacterium]|nr:hypothetical protein [Thiotrichaceae bacterium]
HSFNALLKTLEEPPPHVKFLLATTDPQKLPVTILSRCLQFNLKSLTIEQIEQQLSLILNTENIPFAQNILKPLAIAADGSMRDALSLLDQAIAYCDAKPNLTDIEAMLGSVQKERIFELLTALANDDGLALITQSRILIEQGIDVKTVLAELITTLQRIALSQHIPDAIDDSLGDKNAIQSIAAAISAEDIQLYYQIALNGRKDLPYSPQPQGGFEMILLRMLAFKPVNTQPREKIAVPEIEKNEAPVKQATSVSKTSTRPPSDSPSLKTQDNVALDNTMPMDNDLPPLEAYSQDSHYESQGFDEEHSSAVNFSYGHDAAASTGLKKKPLINESADNLYHPRAENTANAVEQSELTSGAAENNIVELNQQQQKKDVRQASGSKETPCLDEKSNEFATYWFELIERSQIKGLVQQLAKHCALVSQSEQENKLVLQLLLESVHKHLLNDKMKKRLQEALTITLARDIRLEIKECQLEKSEKLQTPRLREIQQAEILQQEAVKSIQTDSAVNLLLNSFSAQLREETIKPS